MGRRAFVQGALIALCCLALALRARASDVAANEEVSCPACAGTGFCTADGCHQGKILCPRTCLKKEVGRWEKMHVDGHSDDELWQTIADHAWTQYHIGELIEVDNGHAVNKGKCPTCQGTSHIACPICGGSGACSLCRGTNTVAKETAKKWEAQRKDESAAQGMLATLHEAEKKAGTAQAQLIPLAKNYLKLAKLYPDTPAGKQARADAERIAKALH